MTKTIRKAIFLMAAAVLVIPGTAVAAQTKATEEPTTSDNLTQLSDKCASEKEQDANGDIIASAKACLRFYSLSPAEETDPERDYGVVWLQSYVDAKNDWCVRDVKSDIEVPAGTSMHAAKPGDKSPDEKKRVKTKLKVDAEGTATETAKVKQSYILYPNRLKTAKKQGEAGATIWHLKWSGRKAKPLAFASGAEISWAVADGPPANLKFALEYFVERTDNC